MIESELFSYMDALVEEIQDQHCRETESWFGEAGSGDNPYVLKNRRVCEIETDRSIRDCIADYREHHISDLVMAQYLDRTQRIYHIECRVKATNSIDERIDEYLKRGKRDRLT